MKPLELPKKSIFSRLYEDAPFVDRFADDRDAAVDVIIPIMHTNDLWRANLRSIYREIPVKRLLISDGGCIDDSIAVVSEFPRVTVLDHRQYVSLGFCLRKLIEAVETEWFIYLHSDVFLEQGWFDAMRADQSRFDWFESTQHTALMAEVPHRYQGATRAFSGAQMGRRKAFDGVLPRIDDDFLYRNEDIVLADLVRRAGFRYGRSEEALIYHQQMNRRSRWLRDIDSVVINIRKSADEELREMRTQLYGILKYMEPDPATFVNHCLMDYIYSLRIAGQLQWDEFRLWIEKENPGWWPIIQRARNRRRMRALYLRIVTPVRTAVRQGSQGMLRMLGF